VNATPRPLSPHAVSLQSVADRAGVSQNPQHVQGPPAPEQGVVVTGVTLDSRAIQPGDLYAALPGANVHGVRFVDAAVALGAVAVLTDPTGAALLADHEIRVPVLVVQEPRAVLGSVASLIYGGASESMTMLGITGTNGKTTTAYLLDSALRALGCVTGLIGTVETRIGQDRIKSTRTTPESPDLHALFALMLERGVDTCTMEVSSHALSFHRVDGVRYDVAAFTNLSQDHLDFHGSMEEYFLAKAALFTPARAVRAVVCVDDEWGQRLAVESGVPVVTLSSVPGVTGDWQIETRQPHEPAFELVEHVGDRRRLSLRSALPGDFNRVNTALAALILLSAGHPAQAVQSALATDPHVPGRMETVRVTSGHDADQRGADRQGLPLAVVDFAHTPFAVAAALSALRPSTSGSLIVVLGAGGDRDAGKRAAMGAAAAANADVVYVTDDNPRSEDPASIRSAVLAGAFAEQRSDQSPEPRERSGHDDEDVRHTPEIIEIGDRAEAVAEAVAKAGPGDTVVVLGKGHESGQDIGGVVRPFDDRAHLSAALERKLLVQDGAPAEQKP
jgi:UDP-N-acetylmuramoyl-L-alanyl-D-glutamate--2,6-diaminopimelate ligase